MKNSAKDISIISLTVALLIAGQYVLSMIAGVEIVTVLFVSFCVVFGVKRGMLCATVFSVLRCVFFGFFPTVIVLYLVFYNLMAIVFGCVGRSRFNKYILVVIIAVIMTCVFTLLDDLITPIMLGMTINGFKVYFLASLPTIGLQCANVALTVGILHIPLKTLFEKVRNYARY